MAAGISRVGLTPIALTQEEELEAKESPYPINLWIVRCAKTRAELS